MYVRGSCTDKNWESGNCPDVCVNSAVNNMASGWGVGQCPGSEAFFCIDSNHNTTDCSTGSNVFKFARKCTALAVGNRTNAALS